jgi:hypothetical protein
MHENGGNEQNKDGVSNPTNDAAGSETIVKANSQNEIDTPQQSTGDAKRKQKGKRSFGRDGT